MTTGLMSDIYMFVLAILVGYEVITKVPSTLHTPLMSATNALSAISVVGAIVVAGHGYKNESPVATWLGFIAVISASINVIGGFLITDRMLKMFKRELPVKPAGKKRNSK